MEEPSVTTLPRGLAAFDLKGRVAVITGASSGIGRSFASAILMQVAKLLWSPVVKIG